MKKIIKRQTGVCVNVRDNSDRVKEEFYSHDKNNAFIELRLNNVNAEKVIVLFHFKTTNRFLEVVGVVEDNIASIPFDTSLITTDEIVDGFVYAEKVVQSADILKFSFGVRVSEIDKHGELPIIEKDTKRVIDVKDIVTKDDLESLLPKNNAPGVAYDDSELRAEIASKANQSEIAHILDDIELLKAKPDNDTIYNDKPLVGRVEALENKPSVDTSNLVTRDELDSKGYLTQHQSLDGYAKKSEIPQPYNDSGVKQRLSAIEQKEPQKLSLSGNTVSLSGGGGSIVLPSAPANTGGQVHEYEIHGQGMPNGRVSAPVGTTYVDTVATNKALKWIKRFGTDNQGWEVLVGDTGWINLPIVSKLGSSYLKVRRVNNTVMYQFGGLSWGWFGVVRRGGAGYQVQPSDRDRNCYILGLNGIPQGFRSESSLIGGIYNDKGTPYGTWYLGGVGDSNMLRFQFTDPVPTNKDIGDIRVSAISYLTSDPWPTTLP